MVTPHITKQEEERTLNLPYKLNKHLTYLLKGFKWAVHNKNTSVVMICDGRSGMGKTSLMCQVGLYCTPNFSLDNVHFTPEEFLDGLRDAKKGDFVLFDEAMLISSRSAMSQINKMIVMAMAMIRSKQIFVGFCCNSIFDLDRNLALSRADLLLNVYGDSLTDRGKFMAFFKGEDARDRIKELYLNGKKYYSYYKPKSNFNTTFSSYFTLDNDEYEEKKQKGIDIFLKATSARPHDIKHIQARDKYILWLDENTDLDKQQIAKIGGIVQRTIYNAIKRAKELKDEQKKG